MAKKLSEFLKENNLTEADLLDDELDLPISELRKRLKVNADNYTKGQQRASELENLVRQHEAYKGHLESQIQGLTQKAEERARDVKEAGGDWRKDPIFQDMARDWDSLSQTINENQTAIAKGLVGIAQEYQTDRKRLMEWIDKQEIRELKRTHTDFDPDKLREWAKEKGVNTTWEDAYTRWRADQMPTLLSEAEKRGREAALTEHGDKLQPVPETEMGHSSRPAGVGGGEPKKDYKGAWSGLAEKLAAAERQG